MTSEEQHYRLHWTTPLYLDKVRRHTEPYTVDVAGMPVLVFPEVMSPLYDWAGHFMIENLPKDLSGKTVLEIGSGCGLVSIHALIRGADSLLAVDINPVAVANTLENFKKLNLTGTAAESDVFSAVTGTFDFIIFNAPYHGCEAVDMLERGVADPNYASLRRFFADVRAHLAAEGRVLFGFSESGDLPLARRLIENAGLEAIRTVSDVREGYQCMVFDLKVAADPSDR